jgi:HEAT repeat protein
MQDIFTELTSGDDTRSEAAALSLSALPAWQIPEAVEVLKDLSASADEETRWWGLRAIASLSHPEIPALLTTALCDEEACVRQCAALGLRLHPDERAITTLVHALADPDRLVAALAVDALAAIGEPAVPALLDTLDHGQQPARLAAVRALAVIGDTRSIPALFSALDEDSAWMEFWATKGLERMGVGMMFFKP